MANELPLEELLAFVDETLEYTADYADTPPSLEGRSLLFDTLYHEARDDSSLVGQLRLDQTVTAFDERDIRDTATKKKRFNKNKARDERRFILIQLRDEVEKLTFTLKQLQNLRDKQHQTTEHTRQDVEQRSEVPAVWQDIRARQLQQRLTAERENSRLKQELEREKELVISVQKLLYKRGMPKETGPEADKQTRRTNIPPGYAERMAAFIFDELAAGVDTLYQEVSGTLEAGDSFTTVQRPLLRGGVEGKAQKLYDRKALSFSQRKAGEVWWRAWHDHRGRNVHESLGDTIVETFGLEMDDFNANVSASSYGQQILRRSIQEHRVMYVWNAYVEPFVFQNEQVSGIYFLEQCYVCIKSESGNLMSGVDESSSNMSTSYTITPYFLTSELRKDPRARTLVDFFVSSIFATIKSRSENVENLLLDQALEKFNSG
ncbi:hypothetical protein GN958_ATG08733 [Phytophthora infestans]|uniref:M96 mating-specific protein family n=1 Tax=Phytophthora infestans TaxID=4787 RepID=A0A8S9UNA9_PHYIN|nr:hypothetical protein GN958_ATG08733 [Phytophthora infestans]